MKRLITLLTAIVFTANLLAQAPQKMSYQAVVRDNNSALITSAPIGMKVSIIQGSVSGTTVYSETHTANTNANGLVSLEIGTGVVLSGSFTSINWANGPYFIKTETDPTGGINYTIIGTSELLSVPYALHAKTAESITGGVTETDPVFVASPANGISSADISNWNNKLSSEVDGSVTNELQTLSISNDTVYLSNGGFAKLPIGFNGDYNSLINKPTAVSSFSNDAGYLTSFTEVDGSVTNELQTLSISNDTVYLSNGGFAKLPAGFNGDYNSLTNKPTAVSSFSNDAGYLTSFTEVDGSVTNELQALSISNDTIYLSNGGFAKLPANNAWSLNGNSGTNAASNFIGTTDNVPLSFRVNNQNAGRIYPSTQSTYFGLGSGFLFAGVRNTAFGQRAMGNQSGGDWNCAFGESALHSNNGGFYNTAIGADALSANTTGNNNVGVGGAALYNNRTGSKNTGIGEGALASNNSGSENTGIGSKTLYNNTLGEKNTSIGSGAGQNNSGSSNVFLGYQAGYYETGSNKLYIANTNTTIPLIYGDFASGRIGLGTTTPTFKLEVTDDALFNGVRVGAGNGGNFKNAVLGYQALQSNTSGQFNTAIGYQVMYPNTTGEYNTAVGTAALGGNTTGSQNCAFGYASLVTRTTGVDNTAYGTNSLRYGTSGDYNSAFGSSALLNNGGNNNTAIGFQTGLNNSSGSGNVFLGYQAGYNESGSNKLYIANSATATPLVYGDFTSGNVGIGTTTIGERLVVQGNHTDGRIATFQNAYDEKYITMGQILTDNGGYVKYKKSSNYTGIGVHGHPEQLIVNGSGNVGIGTTSPTAKLQVAGNAKFGATGQINIWEWDNIEKIGIDYNTVNGDFNMRNPIAGKRLLGTISNTGSWGVENTAGTELVRVTGTGNMGIGTTTPTAKLEVNGAIKVTGGTSSQFLKADGSLDNNIYLTAVYEAADEFTATASQTSFTLTQTPSANSKVKMYINGIRISNTAYSVSGTTLTYDPANNGSYSLSVGDRVQFDYSY